MAEALAKMAGRIFAEIIGGKKEVPILNTRKRPISEARNLSVEESVGRRTCEGRCTIILSSICREATNKSKRRGS